MLCSQIVTAAPKWSVIASLKLKHSCSSSMCPPGGAGELQHGALQESPTWAGRRRGESWHRRDDRQQAADSNPRTNQQGRHGELCSKDLKVRCCFVSMFSEYLLLLMCCFCRSPNEALLPRQTPSVFSAVMIFMFDLCRVCLWWWSRIMGGRINLHLLYVATSVCSYSSPV